ncbi:MAG: sulfatase-like hydrolase/transferase [Planctomycetota bacterium]
MEAANRYLKSGWDEYRRRRYDRQIEMGLIDERWRLPPRPTDIGAWEDDPNRRWQAERMAVYAAQVHCLDRNIGRILTAVERSGAGDNTLVMFLSDNGAAKDGGLAPADETFNPFVHRPDWRVDGGKIRAGSSLSVMPGPGDTFAAYGPAWANLSNTPFRQYKWSAYEGGINSPCIVYWPAVIKNGNRITRHVGQVMDIVPTCLEAAEVDYPVSFQNRRLLSLEGRSLVPIFEDRPSPRDEALLWYVGSRAVRMGRWKLVSADERSGWELYDLETDGTELNDLSADQPERVREMVDAYKRWAARVGVHERAFPPSLPRRE